MTITLDLGCGTTPGNPYGADEVIGIDLTSSDKSILAVDLAIEPIPFPDNHFDFVTAKDILQQIPRLCYVPQRRNCFIELMNEVYRVLKPGGLFLSITPAYPKEAVFRDPTHVNIITAETFTLYFDSVNCWARVYGFNGAFAIESQDWSGTSHLVTLMRKTAA